MKKKDFEKLISEQNIEVDFDKIQSKIDYSKYEKEPKKSVVLIIRNMKKNLKNRLFFDLS